MRWRSQVRQVAARLDEQGQLLARIAAALGIEDREATAAAAGGGGGGGGDAAAAQSLRVHIDCDDPDLAADDDVEGCGVPGLRYIEGVAPVSW